MFFVGQKKMFPLIFRVYSFKTKQIKAAKQSEAKSREGIKTRPNMILKVFQSGRKLVNFRCFFRGVEPSKAPRNGKLTEPPHIERHPCGETWDLGSVEEEMNLHRDVHRHGGLRRQKAHLSIQPLLFVDMSSMFLKQSVSKKVRK